MSQTALDFLWSPSPPWVYVGVGEPGRSGWNPSHFYARDGMTVCTRRLRGWKMHRSEDVMSEIGAALQLFDEFGENWYALEECLCYLDEWLPAQAYVIVVERAEEMLLDDEEALAALLATFDAAGEFWSRPVNAPERFERPPAPFHLLLNVDERQADAVDRIARVAAAKGVSLRRDVG
jgi:hypothetical protein